MAPAVQALEAAVLDRRIRHGGHPILRWNVANAAVETDAAGNRKISKRRAIGHVDGLTTTPPPPPPPISLLMAIGCHTAAPPAPVKAPSVYQSRGHDVSLRDTCSGYAGSAIEPSSSDGVQARQASASSRPSSKPAAAASTASMSGQGARHCCRSPSARHPCWRGCGARRRGRRGSSPAGSWRGRSSWAPLVRRPPRPSYQPEPRPPWWRGARGSRGLSACSPSLKAMSVVAGRLA